MPGGFIQDIRTYRDRYRAAMARRAAMPYNVRRSKRLFKKRYRPSRLPLCFPKSYTVRLPLVFRLKVDPAASANSVTTTIWKANGLYDIRSGDDNIQPLCFDHYTNIYNEWVVLASSTKVEMVSEGTTAANSVFHVALSIKDDATEVTDVQSVLNPKSYHKTIMLPNSYNGMRTLKMGANMKKFFGVKNLGPDYGGNASSDPTEQCHYHLSVVGTASATPGDVYALVTTYYTVRFSEPKDIAATTHS